MKLTYICVVVFGFIILSLSIYGQIANAPYEAAMGVFFMMVGFSGFISLRITQLEKAIEEIRKGLNN